MSYEPTVWESGDVVTSAKLNKLENGVAGAGGVMTVQIIDGDVEGTSVLDKTYAEISAAFEQGPVFARGIDSEEDRPSWGQVAYVYNVVDEYTVEISIGRSTILPFVTDDPDGYPTKGGFN